MHTVDEQWHPTLKRRMQIRESVLTGRLGSMLRREHVVVTRLTTELHYRESLDETAWQVFLSSLSRGRDGDVYLNALLERVPGRLRTEIEMVALPSPSAEQFGERFVKAFNRRRGKNKVELLVLANRDQDCQLADRDRFRIRGKKILIVDAYRHLGRTMDAAARELRSHSAIPIAGLVFLELFATPLPMRFPVFSVQKRPVNGVSAYQCLVCRQARARARSKF